MFLLSVQNTYFLCSLCLVDYFAHFANFSGGVNWGSVETRVTTLNKFSFFQPCNGITLNRFLPIQLFQQALFDFPLQLPWRWEEIIDTIDSYTYWVKLFKNINSNRLKLKYDDNLKDESPQNHVKSDQNYNTDLQSQEYVLKDGIPTEEEFTSIWYIQYK